jgi:hypothetical protein
VAAAPVDPVALTRLLALVECAAIGGEPPPKAELADCLRGVVPELAHRETGKSLDGKL